MYSIVETLRANSDTYKTNKELAEIAAKHMTTCFPEVEGITPQQALDMYGEGLKLERKVLGLGPSKRGRNRKHK